MAPSLNDQPLPHTDAVPPNHYTQPLTSATHTVTRKERTTQVKTTHVTTTHVTTTQLLQDQPLSQADNEPPQPPLSIKGEYRDLQSAEPVYMIPVQTTPAHMTPEQTTATTNPTPVTSRPCVRAAPASPAPECKPSIKPSHVNLSPSPHTAAQPASTQPPYAQTVPRQTCPRHTVRTTPDSPYYKSTAMTTHNQPSASHTVTRRMQETPVRTTPINRPPARTTPASPTAHHSGTNDPNQEDPTRDATLKARTAPAQTPSAQTPPYQLTPCIASPAQPTSPGPASRHSTPSARAATNQPRPPHAMTSKARTRPCPPPQHCSPHHALRPMRCTRVPAGSTNNRRQGVTYPPTPSRTVTATADTGTKSAGPCLPRVACMRETRRPTCISEPPPPLLCR